MSIGNEVLLIKARIAGKKKRIEEINLRGDSFIRMIRDIIDPYAGDFIDFDMKRALLLMKDFYALWEEANILKAEIAKMEKDLNG